MLLTLDIQKKAAPIIGLTPNSWRFGLSGSSKKLGEDLSDLILTVEGFDNHVYALSKPEAKVLLDETVKVISVFVDIDDRVNTEAAEEDKEAIERFKYALRALYKLKSLLHIVYTKDIPVGKTPDSIKEGLAAVSRAVVLNNLSKHTS